MTPELEAAIAALAAAGERWDEAPKSPTLAMQKHAACDRLGALVGVDGTVVLKLTQIERRAGCTWRQACERALSVEAGLTPHRERALLHLADGGDASRIRGSESEWLLAHHLVTGRVGVALELTDAGRALAGIGATV